MSQAPYALCNARFGTRLGTDLKLKDKIWVNERPWSACYNRSIARCLFLGEQGATSQNQEPKARVDISVLCLYKIEISNKIEPFLKSTQNETTEHLIYSTAQLPMKEINDQLFLTWNDISLFMSRSSTPI